MILDMLLNESVDSNIEFEVEPTNNGYTPSLFGMNTIISECMQDVHSINTACAVAEYKSLQLISESSINEAVILQENIFSGFFKKMKDMFMKMLAKIKEFFGNVKLYFSKAMTADKFLKEYETELSKCSTSGFKYEGYKFTLDAVRLDAAANTIGGDLNKSPFKDPSKIVSEVKNAAKDEKKKEAFLQDIKEQLDNKDDIKKECFENARKALCGEKDESDFKEAMFKKLRNNKDSEEEINVNVGDVIKTIKLKDNTLTQIESSRKAAEKLVNDAIGYVTKCITAVESIKEDDDAIKTCAAKSVEGMKATSSMMSSACNIINSAAGYKVDAAKKNYSQARDIARKLLVHNRKERKKVVNASFEYDGENILDQFMM